MKKLVVLMISIVLILSIASISSAAVTVNTDFRYEYINISGNDKNQAANGSQAEAYDNADFRIIVDYAPDTNPKYSGHMQLRTQTTGKPTTEQNYNLNSQLDFYADEYWINWQKSWGNIRIGNWDWKITPSRVLVKASGNNIFPRSQSSLAIDVPLGSVFYTGANYVIDGSSDSKVRDGAYDLKLGFKTQKVGLELHGYDCNTTSGVETGTAWDLWYQAFDSVKFYVYGHDVEYTNSDPDPETIFGILFTNLGGVKGAQISLEYGIDKTDPIIFTKEYNQYGLQAIYPFASGWQVEYELTNLYMKLTSADVETKHLLRLRLKSK